MKNVCFWYTLPFSLTLSLQPWKHDEEEKEEVQTRNDEMRSKGQTFIYPDNNILEFYPKCMAKKAQISQLQPHHWHCQKSDRINTYHPFLLHPSCSLTLVFFHSSSFYSFRSSQTNDSSLTFKWCQSRSLSLWVC